MMKYVRDELTQLNELDLVYVSHIDSDHLSGVLQLLKERGGMADLRLSAKQGTTGGRTGGTSTTGHQRHTAQRLSRSGPRQPQVAGVSGDAARDREHAQRTGAETANTTIPTSGCSTSCSTRVPTTTTHTSSGSARPRRRRPGKRTNRISERSRSMLARYAGVPMADSRCISTSRQGPSCRFDALQPRRRVVAVLHCAVGPVGAVGGVPVADHQMQVAQRRARHDVAAVQLAQRSGGAAVRRTAPL